MATLLKTWSTYYLRSNSSSPSDPDLKGTVKIYLVEQSIAGNYSDIRIDHFYKTYHVAASMSASYQHYDRVSSYRAQNGSYGGTYKNASSSISVLFNNVGYTSDLPLGSTTERIYHNADGTAELYFNGTISAKLAYPTTTYNGSRESSTHFALPTIPRYATINSFTFDKASGAAGLSTLTCGWSANASCDAVQYSLNGGGWTSSGTSGTSGSFNIGGLALNTPYSLKIRVKRTDSQLWTESSTINATTYDYAKITGADSINDTGTPYMTFTNPSGAVINAKLEGGSQNIQRNNISNVGSYSFTLTSEEINMLRATIPNAPSMTLRYVIATVVDGVETYWTWLDRKFTIVNANPTFTTWTYADTNAATLALTGSNQKIIKGYSNVKATITSANKMVAIKGATPISYQLTIGTKPSATANYSPSSTVEMTINAVDNSVMTCYAKDSRENSTPKAITASTYINYTPISISAATGTRTDDIGTQTTLAYNGTFFNASFGSVSNSVKSATYKFKKTTDVSYTNGTSVITPTKTGGTFSFSGTIKGDAGTGGVNGFNATYSYNIQVIVTDELSTHTFNFILGTGTPNIAISQNGVAINQAYDETLGGALQVNGPAYIDGINVKAFAEIGLTSNLSFTSANHEVEITPTILFSNGITGKLSISSNDIVIDSDVNYIVISGSVLAQNFSGNAVLIVKADDTIVYRTFMQIAASGNNTLYLPAKTLAIGASDVNISLHVTGQTGGAVTSNAALSAFRIELY